MSVVVVITLCLLLLIAYVFDITSKYTRVPSVIMLMALGFFTKYLLQIFGFEIKNLNAYLPAIGSVGLILIVLEGSLELEVSKDKNGMILKSFLVALIPMIILLVLISVLIFLLSESDFYNAMLNAIPLCVISSAIAIPSVKNLGKFNKEFVIYESSFSDILGVLLFNFYAMNEAFSFLAIGNFLMQIVIMLVFALIATLLLSLLLNNIKHHVKFLPIIILVILIYELSKVFHLPGLIFVLIFGLFLGNLNQLEKFNLTRKFKITKLKGEVHKFTEITVEAAFVIRASFFVLFGFLLEASEILNLESLPIAFIIFSTIILVRILILLIYKLPFLPLMFIAPRGLITILLFLSIPISRQISIINNSVIIQVVILTAIWMMIGLMFNKSPKKIKADQ
ncbi:MAG TPA: sodium:proton antiporter [Bacteroidia bacterium]